MFSFSTITNSVMDFFLIVFANFIAIFLFWIGIEGAKSNIPILRILFNWRYNYLAALYKEIRDRKLQGLSNEVIQKELQQKYRDHSFTFMMREPKSQKAFNDICFIGDVINSKEALFEFANSLSFGRKEYKRVCKIINEDENEKQVRNALLFILKDTSSKSVDSVLYWLPIMLTPDKDNEFIPDPECPDKKIKMLENYFSIICYIKPIYLKDSVTQEQCLSCVKILAKKYSNIRYPSGVNHAAKYTKMANKKEKRKEVILNKIKEYEKVIK